MTEDGRSFGWPAPCSPRLSPIRASGNRDAQQDAMANSLRPAQSQRQILRFAQDDNLVPTVNPTFGLRGRTNCNFLPIPRNFQGEMQ